MAKVAAEYLNSVSHQAAIEDYKDSILMLKAGGVSYEKIAKLLNAHQIQVSISTIRKICMKHEQEIARLQSDGAEQTKAKLSAPESASLSEESRPSLIGDPGKRGPRQARDQL